MIIEQCLAPVPGGTGRYARQVTAAMAQGPPPGWTVRTVTAWHRDTTIAAIPGADGPHRLPVGHRVLAELWRRGLPPLVRGDQVHATTPLAPGCRHGLVVTVHDAVPWTHPETLTPRGVSWHRTMVARAAERADAIVVPSLAVADDLAGLFPSAAGRLHVIGHGVTALHPSPDADQLRQRLGLPDGYVLCVATLEPRKGLDVLVTAMSHPGLENAHLAVVGPAGWGSVNLWGWPPVPVCLLSGCIWWATSQTRNWRRCTTERRCSRPRPELRGSAYRCSKQWPQVCRWWCPTLPRSSSWSEMPGWW